MRLVTMNMIQWKNKYLDTSMELRNNWKAFKNIWKDKKERDYKMAKNKFETKLLRSLINEEFGEEEQDQGITSEQKRSFTEAVGNYHTLGESVYRNSSLREITEQLGEIVKVAESLTLKESEHWFDNVTTSRHMKQLGEAYKVFAKTANEVHTLQQRLESAYEDMGGTLNKYYKISEALKEDGKPDYLDMDKDGDTEEPMKAAIAQK